MIASRATGFDMIASRATGSDIIASHATGNYSWVSFQSEGMNNVVPQRWIYK